MKQGFDQKPCRVLIVDDDSGLRLLLAELIRKFGYDVREADSAAAARVCLNEVPESFDLVLMDIILPDGSGLDLAKELACPVLFVTQCGNAEDVDRACQSSALRDITVGYVVKSSDPIANMLPTIKAAIAVGLRRRVQAQALRMAMDMVERDRQSVARELHDEFGSSLTAIRLLAGVIRDTSSNRMDVERAGKIAAMSEQLQRFTHHLIDRLRPEILDDLSLSDALRELVRGWAGFQSNCRYDISIIGDIDHLDETTAPGIYRIVQEALTNAARYSEATAIAVAIHRSDEGISIEIKDNGSGIGASTKRRGGLAVIGERADLLGGEFNLESGKAGTTIAVTLPAYRILP